MEGKSETCEKGSARWTVQRMDVGVVQEDPAVQQGTEGGSAHVRVGPLHVPPAEVIYHNDDDVRARRLLAHEDRQREEEAEQDEVDDDEDEEHSRTSLTTAVPAGFLLHVGLLLKHQLAVLGHHERFPG